MEKQMTKEEVAKKVARIFFEDAIYKVKNNSPLLTGKAIGQTTKPQSGNGNSK